MKKDCTTCKYEPEWSHKLWSTVGYCRWGDFNKTPFAFGGVELCKVDCPIEGKLIQTNKSYPNKLDNCECWEVCDD